MISTSLLNKIEKMSKRDLKNYPQSNKKQWPRWQKHGQKIKIPTNENRLRTI